MQFGPSWQWPKPVQARLPVWIGGGKATLSHVVEWGDGWLPLVGPIPVAKLLKRLRQMADDAERDPASIAVYTSGFPADPAEADELLTAGIDGFSLSVDWDASGDLAMRQLDEHVARCEALGFR